MNEHGAVLFVAWPAGGRDCRARTVGGDIPARRPGASYYHGVGEGVPRRTGWRGPDAGEFPAGAAQRAAKHSAGVLPGRAELVRLMGAIKARGAMIRLEKTLTKHYGQAS